MFNGGTPERHAVDGGPYEIEVHRFYSVGGESSGDIFLAIRSTGPFPEGYLPIGTDQGGNSFLLSTRGRDRGAVYYWDHERELDQPNPDEPTLTPATKLADDFDAFFGGLVPD